MRVVSQSCLLSKNISTQSSNIILLSPYHVKATQGFGDLYLNQHRHRIKLLCRRECFKENRLSLPVGQLIYFPRVIRQTCRLFQQHPNISLPLRKKIASLPLCGESWKAIPRQ